MEIARYICDVSFRPRSVDLMRLTIAESRRFPDFMMNLIQKTFAHFRASVALMFDDLTARKLAPAADAAKSAALFTDLILGATPLLVYAGWASSRPTDAELEAKIEFFILGRYGPNSPSAPAERRPLRRTAPPRRSRPEGQGSGLRRRLLSARSPTAK